MKNEIVLNIDHSQLELATKKLIEEIAEDEINNLNLSHCQSLCDIFEGLSVDTFGSLQKNVYFSDWLRAIGLSISDKEEVEDLEHDPLLGIDDPPSGFSPRVVLVENEKLMLPPLNTSLDKARLPNKFLKLFKRLNNVAKSHATFYVGDKIEDILSLTVEDLSSLPRVGKSYEEALTELKELYSNEQLVDDEVEDVSLDGLDFDNMVLYHANLTNEQIKALEKLERFELIKGVDTLLELNLVQVSSMPGFGQSVINELAELQNNLLKEVRSIVLSEIDFEAWEGQFLVPRYPHPLPIEQVGTLLLEDIDKYFDKIPELELSVVQKRWGFVEEKKTLEEIGEEYDLTRERIRQIAKKANDNLFRNLRFTQDFIWEMLEPELSKNIKEHLEDLYSCFSNERDFYEVLGVLSGQQELEKYIRPLIKLNILDRYFADNGGPVIYEDIKEYLVECELESVRNVDNAIHYLEDKGRIKVDGENVWPRNLVKHEAVAFVLANHSNGLPWLDIANFVNANNYSRTDVYTDRLDSAAFADPDNIYLAGKGTYAHTKFIDFGLLSMEDIFDELLAFFDKTGRSIFHLNECYVASKTLMRQDYYVVRHVVKYYGEEYGFFFDGRSQADSVGLEKGFKRITQKDVILEAMRSASKPLTKVQIAALLKSKSINHASYYLDVMLESELVVQVDRMLYTTPSQAYQDIEMTVYLEAIEKLLIAQDKPVDPSMFKEVLNNELSATYSKYFYASIARLSANQRGWYRKHSLYSMSPIPYKNLFDAVQTHCTKAHTNEQNFIVLKQYIAITRDSAVIALSRWRRET